MPKKKKKPAGAGRRRKPAGKGKRPLPRKGQPFIEPELRLFVQRADEGGEDMQE